MPSQNFILDALSPADYEWLRPLLTEVQLQQSEVIYEFDEQITAVYFPTTCLFSLITLTAQGDRVEVGVTSYEGMVGLPLSQGEDRSPLRVEVQLSGKALKLSSKDFLAAIDRSSTLRQRIANFTHLRIVQLAQSALCNRFHTVEERLCRWLLAAQDRAETSEFSLTREILAEMIGAGRPSVSIVSGTLQTAGLIQSDRGKITILNREEMEEAACECYRIAKTAFDRYLAKQIQP
ncbi:Crp/Fnr family transcriptional regulator [Microcoleus sp. FACHB-1515]|uniref:Crp/Fnr family transcriptional regulator n=1 Tax=Cyanophyceae TaxID=3028117 RepID=UPI0016864DF2|nr:Crp/Fnr family transcriptional regulator [Microcoleus sp. FACHB-1515]MBD2089996.1 Crp/Fnr family transcriptional regulator [Microcoleus sp. FACHB-1515]